MNNEGASLTTNPPLRNNFFETRRSLALYLSYVRISVAIAPLSGGGNRFANANLLESCRQDSVSHSKRWWYSLIW